MEIDWGTWGPPLLVLVVGGGVAWRSVAAMGGDDQAQVREGQLDDLAGAHAEALAALKQLELDKPKLDPADYSAEREILLARGAAAMRRLEEARAGVVTPGVAPAPSPAPAAPDVAAAPAAAAAPAPAPVQPTPGAGPGMTIAPEWKGALVAGLVMAVLFVLYTTMQADTQKRHEGMSGSGGGVGTSRQGPPPGMAAGQAQLEAKLAANPGDLATRNDLTHLFINSNNAAGAMEQNQEVLKADPNNLDGLTYKGVLAAMIGMNDKAIQHIDLVLMKAPDHAVAVVYKGLILMNSGKYQEAIPVLERAVQLMPNSGLEGKLLDARAMAEGRPPPSRAGMPGAPPPGGASGDPSAVMVSGRATLPAGIAVGPGDVVFVSVKDPAGGPPIAAKKYPASAFPLDFVVTEGDKLPMSASKPTPARLNVAVNIDMDGNAFTKDFRAFSGVQVVEKGSTGLEVALKAP